MENISRDNIYEKIKQLSNLKKFKIVDSTSKEKTITELSKIIKISFNKCSNYCTELEKVGLIVKKRDGKNILIKSTLSLSLLFPKTLKNS